MKHNYNFARRVYSSTCSNIAEQFKMYLNSLPPEKMDKIKNNFCANGNGLLPVQDTESTADLFDSFAIFCHMNSRLPYTTAFFLF